MPFKTQYGTHYHMTEGCSGATIPCGTEGLEPCAICCGNGGGRNGEPSGDGLAGGSAPSAGMDGEYAIDDGTPEVDGENGENGETDGDASTSISLTGDAITRGESGLTHGQSAPSGDVGRDDIKEGLERASNPDGHDALAQAGNRMYTSRAVPEIVLTEDELAFVAKVLTQYAMAETVVGEAGTEMGIMGVAGQQEFLRVLGAMKNDIIQMMDEDEHIAAAKRELQKEVERRVAANFHPVMELEPTNMRYLPFASFPVEFDGYDLCQGIPDATGWEGMPFVDANRDGYGYTPVWDYLPEPFETGEPFPARLTVGRYQFEATVTCGITPDPKNPIRGDRDYGLEVSIPEPARPRVTGVRMASIAYNGRKVPLDGEMARDFDDFDDFRNALDDWLADRERIHRPAFGHGGVDRKTRAFLGWQAKKRQRQEKERQHHEEYLAHEEMLRHQRAERMSRL